LGSLAGHWLQAPREAAERALGLVAAGAVAAAAGELVDPWFPINKALCSSSFVLLAAGIAAIGLGACTWVVEGKAWRRWAAPFLALGTNALAVYLLSTVVASVMERVTVTSSAGAPEGLRLYLFERFFLPWAGGANGSVCFAAAYLLAWLSMTTF